jgi:signal transduction histidine kinase
MSGAPRELAPILQVQHGAWDAPDLVEDPLSELASEAVLQDVGNLVTHLQISIQHLRREWSGAVAVQSLRRLVDLAESRPEDLARALLDRSGSVSGYLRAMLERLEVDHAAADAALGRMGGAIDEVRDLVRAHHGARRGRREQALVEIAGAVDEVLALISVLADERGVRLVREGEGALAARVDRQRLTRVLVNLLTNALDAVATVSPERRRVTVVMRRAPGGVAIDVIDEGVGVAPELVGRVFTQGFTTKREGNGLGLAWCARMAASMGGTLELHSDGVDRGARFTLTLPLRPPHPRGTIPPMR